MTGPGERWFVAGLGRAGLPVARVLAREGLLTGAWTRTEATAARARPFVGDVAVGGVPDPRDADVVLVAVPDDRIGRLVAAVDAGVRAEPGRVWLHTSGAHDRSVLTAAGVAGPCGSCHPLQALAAEDGAVSPLLGAYFAVEGDAAAVDAAARLARLAGGTPATLPPEAKVAYHAAAVLASNGVYALLRAARTVCEAAGIADPALAVGLAKLAAVSATNAAAAPLETAATGPVVRGDAGTVAAHLEWLARHRPDLVPLYAELSEQLAGLAEEGGRAPERALATVRALLARAVQSQR